MSVSGGQDGAALREAILADAKAEAEVMLQHTRSAAENLLEQARAGVEAERQAILAQAQAKAELKAAAILAAIPGEATRLRSARQELVLESVREKAAERLAGCDGFDYRSAVISLAAEAISQMEGDSFVLELSAVDKGLLGETALGEIKALAGRKNVSIGFEATKDFGIGVVIRDGEGRQLWDNRLAARLVRMWPGLRRLVAVETGLTRQGEAKVDAGQAGGEGS